MWSPINERKRMPPQVRCSRSAISFSSSQLYACVPITIFMHVCALKRTHLAGRAPSCLIYEKMRYFQTPLYNKNQITNYFRLPLISLHPGLTVLPFSICVTHPTEQNMLGMVLTTQCKRTTRPHIPLLVHKSRKGSVESTGAFISLKRNIDW